MSETIDDRVVQMQFRNEQFEKNANETLNTLDRLKEKLNFKAATKSIEELNYKANSFDTTTMVSSVEAISNKFSALEIVATTALVRITNSAINTGKRLVESLTIDQLSGGWSKYEQKTANVQTLINSTGKSIEEVEGYLDQLMWYSDQTSFGFSDMTSALSTMVSAGGDIDKLIPMIEGMGNAVAYAGKGAGEFSRVIYNLNQSYSMGSLMTMDWRSVENAGAASKQLKEFLMQAAEEVGTIQKGTSDISKWSTYLSDKKITSEAMEIAFSRFSTYTRAVQKAVEDGTYETCEEAMENMSVDGFDAVSVAAFEAAQKCKTFNEAIDATKDAVSSGWLKSWELIVGNKDEAVELWSDLGMALWNAFAAGAEARNEMLKMWKEMGGREDLIESFWNVWNSIATILGSVKEAFRDLFPPMTADSLHSLTERMKAFTTTMLEYTKKYAPVVKTAFTIFFSVIKGIAGFIKGVFSIVLTNLKKILVAIFGDTEAANNSLAAMAEWFKDLTTKGAGLEKVLNAIGTVAGFVGDGIAFIVSSLKNLWESFKNIPFVASALSSLDAWFTIGSNAAEGITEGIKGNSDSPADAITETGEGIIESFQEVMDEHSPSRVMKALGVFLIFGLVKGIVENLPQVKDATEGIGYTIKKALESVTEGAKGGVESLKNIVKGIGSFIKDILGSFTFSLGSITDTLQKVIKYITSLLKPILNDISAIALVKLLMNIANQVGAVNKVLKSTSKVIKSFSKVCNSTASLIKNVGKSLRDVAKGVKSYLKRKGFKETANGILQLSAAFLLITATVAGLAYAMSYLDGNEDIVTKMWHSVGIITVIAGILLTLGLVLSKFEDSAVEYDAKAKKFIATIHTFGLNIAGLGLAILAMAGAAAIIANSIGTDWEKGLLVLVQFLGYSLIAVGAVKIMAKELSGVGEDLKQLRKALIPFGICFVLIAAAFKILETIDPDAIGDAVGVLVVFGGVIAALTFVSKYAQPKALSKLSLFLSVLGPSLILLVAAAKLLTLFTPDEQTTIVDSMFVIGGFIAGIMLISKLAYPSKVNSLSLFMAAIGPALLLTATTFKIMGLLTPTDLGISILALTVLSLFVAGMGIIADKAKDGLSSGSSLAKFMLSIGAALTLMSVNLVLLSLFTDPASIIIGLGSITLFVCGMTKLMNVVPSGGKLKNSIAFALAMSLFVAAISFALKVLLSSMADPGAMLSAAGAISMVLLAMSGALWILSKSGKIAASAIVGAAVMSAAIVALSYGLSLLQNGGVGSMLSAAGALAIIVAVMAGALVVLSKFAPGAIAGAAAMLVLSAAILVLTPAILAMQKIKWENIWQGLLAFGVVLVVVVAVGLFADAAAVGLLAVAAAIVAIAVASFLGAYGFNLVSEAIIDLTTSFPEMVSGFVEGCDDLAKKILEVCEDILSILDTLTEYTPQFIDKGADLVTAISDGLSEKAPQLTAAGIQLLTDFANSTADALNSDKGTELAKAFKNLTNSILICILKLIKGFDKEQDKWDDAVKDGIIKPMLVGLATRWSEISEWFGSMPEKIKEAITEKWEAFKLVGKYILEGIEEGLYNFGKKMPIIGGWIADEFNNGFTDAEKIESPSKVWAEYGGYLIKGLANGVHSSVGLITDSVDETASALDPMKEVINGVVDSLESDSDFQPTIRPVLDLSDIRAGAGSIGNLFSNSPTLALAGNASYAMSSRSTTSGNDILSALNDLKSTIMNQNAGNTYNINGITYGDDSAISDAIQQLIRATRMERRM